MAKSETIFNDLNISKKTESVKQANEKWITALENNAILTTISTGLNLLGNFALKLPTVNLAFSAMTLGVAGLASALGTFFQQKAKKQTEEAQRNLEEYVVKQKIIQQEKIAHDTFLNSYNIYLFNYSKIKSDLMGMGHAPNSPAIGYTQKRMQLNYEFNLDPKEITMLGVKNG